MLETAITHLREKRTDIALQATQQIDAPTAWSEQDLEILLDLCDEERHSTLLDRIESEGQHYAQANGQLDVRLESIERVADALGQVIDRVFTAEEPIRLAARETLRLARRTYITAASRGFQSAIEGNALSERERARRTLNRLYAVQNINNKLNSTLDFDDSLANAAAIISDEMHVDLCAIFIFESKDELILRATNQGRAGSLGHVPIRLGEPLAGEVAREGKYRIIRDALTLEQSPVESHIFDRPYRGLFVLPIIHFGGDGPLLEGVLTLLNESPRDYFPDEIQFMELIAGQLAMSIENSQIYRRTDEIMRYQFERIRSLQNISASVATSFDLTRVLQMIVSQAVQITGSTHGAIFQLTPDGTYTIGARHEFDSPELRDAKVEDGHCCIGRAIQQGDRVWGLDCMHKDAHCFVRHLPHLMPEVHSSLAMPLLSKGQLQGILFLLGNNRHVQPGTLAKMAETYANEAAVAIESSNLYEDTLRSLAMKSDLLQEMHHRVKNNMLSIAAILRMEKRRTSAPEAARVLSESISRIDGMAATHDLLSQEERIGTANVGDIASKLVGVVSAHLVPPTMRVDFQVRADPGVEVHSKKALVLALVLNELLANAIEHGIADREHGRVRIGTWEEDGSIHLDIADDGANAPENFDINHASSLGLSLVRDMTRSQLRGTFQLVRAPLPARMRDDAQDETPWSIARLIFLAERESITPHPTPDIR